MLVRFASLLHIFHKPVLTSGVVEQIGKAMSEAASMFDSNGAASGNKQDAVNVRSFLRCFCFVRADVGWLHAQSAGATVLKVRFDALTSTLLCIELILLLVTAPHEESNVGHDGYGRPTTALCALELRIGWLLLQAAATVAV